MSSNRTINRTMRAVVAMPDGGELGVTEQDRPTPLPGQVLVRVRASGVNPLDLKIRAGKAPHARQPLPAILGIDLAGEVEAVGAGVSAFRSGDRVFGMTGGVGGLQGSLAEYAAVDARSLVRMPDTLGFREAAAVPLIAITAWEALMERAQLRAEHTLLVLGAGGGVGHIALQLAKAVGAQAFGLDGASKAPLIASTGATPVSRGEAVEAVTARHTDGTGFDVVLDTVGGEALDQAFQAVRTGGKVVSILGWGTHSLAPLSFKGASYSGVFTLLPLLTGEGRDVHAGILREVARLAGSGQLAPVLDPQDFGLDGVEKAHALLSERRAVGKVVVTVAA